ncbi:hypothetical protein LY76DRAFT_673674 [Colletotrichum caudatum]|nr:hypothetical protein LY76DRAFT_673674 [Colletotrichum caudatum]
MTTQPPPSAHMACCRLNRHWGCETMLFFWRGYLDRGEKKKYTAQALGFLFPPLSISISFFYPLVFTTGALLIWDGLQKTSGIRIGKRTDCAYRLWIWCFYFIFWPVLTYTLDFPWVGFFCS